MPRPSQIRIDLDALTHNATLTRQLAGHRKIMAAVKADAYGHGAVACARVLNPHVDAFAVAFVEEAVILRAAGINTPILVLDGPFDSTDVAQINHHNLWTVVHNDAQVNLLRDAQLSTLPPIWLKLDTGMHRLGLAPQAFAQAYDALQAMGASDITLMSHLANAETADDLVSQRQLQRWQTAIKAFDGPTSLGNSAALINNIARDTDWLRPGYMLYGGHPKGVGEHLALLPVMYFKSHVMALRDIKAGETVGYGGRWCAQRNSRIATIPVGYADGYPRHAKDGTPVAIGGKLGRLAGCVSMDMLTVDVTDLGDVHIGDVVTLWGNSPGIDIVAAHADTIGYELSCRMPNRLPRLFEGGH